MQIDRIKISQEVFVRGMPTWIGVEGSVTPEEDVNAGLQKLQKTIIDYVESEEKALSKGKKKQPTLQDDTDKEFELVKQKLSSIEFKEDALAFIASTSFHLSIEAKQIANLKPSKNK